MATRNSAQKSSPAPKPQPAPAPMMAQSSGMGMDSAWKWVYALGAVVAGVAGAIAFKNDILTWILILVGVLLGWFYFDAEDVEHYGLRFLILFAAQAALSAVPAVGAYITGFVGGVFSFLGPIVLTMLVHFFWNKRIASLF